MLFDLIKIIKKEKFIFSIFLSNFFLSFHFFLILFINSNLLNSYFSAFGLSFLYIVASVINLILVLNLPKLIRKYGNYKLLIIFIFLEFIAVLGISFIDSGIFPIKGNFILIALFFIIHQAVVVMTIINMDIFLEGASKNENNTGLNKGCIFNY